MFTGHAEVLVLACRQTALASGGCFYKMLILRQFAVFVCTYFTVTVALNAETTRATSSGDSFVIHRVFCMLFFP